MPAPAFQPPDQPGVDVRGVSPSLQQDASTLSVRGRLGYWAAFTGLLLGAAGLGWRGWHGLADEGWPVADTLFLGGAAELALLLGVLWFGLPLVQDVWRAVYQRRAWAVDLEVLREGAAAQRDTARAYARKWYGTAPPAPAPVVVNDQRTRETLARQEAAIARLEAQLSAAQRAPEPGAARVANPVQNPAEIIPDPDAATRPMVDGRALLGGAYRNGPAWRLIGAAYRGESIAYRSPVGSLMPDGAWRKATGKLAEAGVLTGGGERRPYRLAPPYAGAVDEAAAHMAVLARLWAAGCGPGDLPGDLAGLDPAPTVAPTAAPTADPGTDGPQPPHSDPQETHSP